MKVNNIYSERMGRHLLRKGISLDEARSLTESVKNRLSRSRRSSASPNRPSPSPLRFYSSSFDFATSPIESNRRRNAVIDENESRDENKKKETLQLKRRNMHRRAATTGNIEIIAASQAKQVKIVVMGAQETGKTALLVRFMTKRFISEYSSFEMRYNHFTYVDREIAYFDLLDMCYQNAMNSSTLYENKIKWGDAFIILYDVNDYTSFEEVTRIRYLISHHHMPQKIRQIKNNLRRKIHDNLHKDSKRNTFEADQYFNPPVILIGNKSDGDESRRQVDQKTAEAKAQELDCGFEEISVMNSPYEDIRHVFSNLYRGVRAQEKRSKVNSHIKLANIEEFSDPRKKPHSSSELIRKPEVSPHMNVLTGMRMRKFGDPTMNPSIKSFSIGPT